MVRHLLIKGRKIKLLPLPNPADGEEPACTKCEEDFDSTEHLRRRACWDLCGHVCCLGCIIKSTDGCERCLSEKEVEREKNSEEMPAPPVGPPEIDGEEEGEKVGGASTSEEEPDVDKDKAPVRERRPRILVLSSVLTKVDSDEDTFPAIEKLSLSALPVLECATDPPGRYLDDEEEDIEEIFEECEEELEENDEEQVVPETKHDINLDPNASIPVIDLIDDDEDIPLITLSDDEEEKQKTSSETRTKEHEKAPETHLPLSPPPSTKSNDDKENEEISTEFHLTPRPVSLAVNQKDYEEISPQLPPTPPAEEPENQDYQINEAIINPEPEAPENQNQAFDQEEKEQDENEDKSPRSLRKRRKERAHPSYRELSGATGFGSYICMYCGIGYNEKRTLGLHLYQKHWNFRPYPCDICDWPFVSKRSLQDHRLTHTNERPYECSLCASKFNRDYTLKMHLKKIHDVIPEKKKRHKDQTKTINVKSSKIPKEIQPIVEPEVINSEDSEESIPYHPPPPKIDISVIQRNQPIVCLIDISKSLPMPAPPIHRAEEQKENLMDIQEDTQIAIKYSNLPPKKRLYARKSSQDDDADWTPTTPSKKPKRTTPISTTNHKTTKKYTCCHCKKSFPRKTKLGNHLRQIHADKRPYSCDLCGWSFSQKNKLSLHRITHTKDRPHRCKQCESTFNRKYSLERHVRIMHLKKPRMCEAAENKPSQKKTASCPYCHREFENRDVLASHMRVVHTDRRPHICNQCQWPFVRKKHLVAHMRVHNPDRPYECKMCDGKFNRRFSLERHYDNVHGVRTRLTPEETPQGEEYCPECQSLFEKDKCDKVAYSVCGHISCLDCVVQAAELGCGQCTTENAPKAAFPGETPPATPVKKNGITKRNGDLGHDENFNLEGQIEKNGPKIREEMDGEERKENKKGKVNRFWTYRSNWKAEKGKKKAGNHRCTYCKELFTQRMDLGNHYKTEHPDLRPFTCEVCKWPFSSNKDLERHQLTHTSERPHKCHMCDNSFNRKSTRDRHVERVHLNWRRI